MSAAALPLVAGRLIVRGDVQGVGFRPAVTRLASDLGLSGTVRNAASGVEIHLEGTEEAFKAFRHRLPTSLPATARLDASEWSRCELIGIEGFRIIESSNTGPLTTPVPPDRATCEACLREVAKSTDRRAGYAFTSCVDCGPRYSIIESMPYDRSRTTMDTFGFCPECEQEYLTLGERRCHAQTNACPACGPSLRLHPCRDDTHAPCEVAADIIRQGAILCLCGLGGYQLIVDATNAAAVQRLRERKGRPAKPFAVMVESLAQAESLAVLSDHDREALSGAERPIVLVPSEGSGPLCEEIHPGLRDIGLFLPTTALHWLLLRHAQRPLVVTSGNVDGNPMAASPELAELELNGVADAWLHHNRDIARPIDDSVVRSIAGQGVAIRCARGLAPLTLAPAAKLTSQWTETGSVLAVGGHQKAAVALFNGAQAILGPHIGDLESLAMRERFVEHIERLQALYDCKPQLVVHDLHTDYFSTRWAHSLGSQTLAVQHHHAHIVSGMVENDWLDREVLGVAFDGTGYGIDGTIWGGEFLRTTVFGFERVAHLRPFHLPGGESAIRKPWRVAASLLIESIGESEAQRVLVAAGLSEMNIAAVLQLTSHRQLSPLTSSAGRLFDGVASLILGINEAAYEGHPAMLLEAATDASTAAAYDFDLLETSPLQLDWRPAIRQLVDDHKHRLAARIMAAKFHRGLASAIAKVCDRFDLPVVLSGGVFQNRLLTEQVIAELMRSQREIGLHGRIPPNDGGLAAGQLAIGMARVAKHGLDDIPTAVGES